MKQIITHLYDWLTTDEMPFASKITNANDRVYHDHSFVELFYVTEGSIDHQMNEEPPQTLSRGDLFLCVPGDRHIFLRESETICSHRDIVVREEFFHEICVSLDLSFYEDITSKSIRNHAKLTEEQVGLFERMAAETETLARTNIVAAKREAKFLLYGLLRTLYDEKNDEKMPSYPSWFGELLQRFESPELLCKGLLEITKPFYFAQEYICRSFKKYMNMTMTDYLNRKRLSEAADLLMYSDKSVAKICQEIGFSSSSYFNKIFRDQYGITPLQFRKTRYSK